MYKKIALIVLLCSLAIGKAQAQVKPRAELFCGAELSYADVNFSRLYNVRVDLTPGAKVNLGKGWELDAQIVLPVVNDGYADRYDMFRLNMANVSKTLRFERSCQYFKFTAGLFGKEQYGGDVRWMFPINSWLMVHARLGLTNRWALGWDVRKGTTESELATSSWNFLGIAGASVWLNRWSTELRLTGGRYLNQDYGVEGEAVRHFKHCSVTIFAQLHEAASSPYVKYMNRFTGGFRVVMMLPPYKKWNKKVVVRPSSNFRLTYNAQADGYSMRKYTTDPEENERTYPVRIPWGTGNFDE